MPRAAGSALLLLVLEPLALVARERVSPAPVWRLAEWQGRLLEWVALEPLALVVRPQRGMTVRQPGSPAARVQQRELPVVQPSESPGPQVARQARRKGRVSPAGLASQRPSPPVFQSEQEPALPEAAAQVFPARQAWFQWRRFPSGQEAIGVRIPAPYCPAFDKAGMPRHTPAPE
ncbi:MAG: hypothetical protein HZA88_10095 [Verrucomicrobia bacterium]|nr:hypothetical protein [Verrucomicrobiota bacterium]